MLPRPSRFLTALCAVWLSSGICLAASDSFEPTVSKARTTGQSPPEMVAIPGGEFSMGAGRMERAALAAAAFIADASPIHRVRVDAFWMDRTAVTNKEFARFVAATGYITVAERDPPPTGNLSAVVCEKLPRGSVVFGAPSSDVDLNDYQQWWRYTAGADWRHPSGPHSTIQGKDDYPVVQVAYADALAYAHWEGKRLPSEAEWEFAARGGLTGRPYVWGTLLKPDGKWMANIFEGHFPNKDTGDDGFAGIAPVARFPANGYGLYDMAGNVWQWCSDWYRADYYAQLAKSGISTNPAGPSDSLDPEEPNVPKRVQRGGSFLCSDQYCGRYLVGSRGKADPGSATNHAGFRCVMTLTASAK